VKHVPEPEERGPILAFDCAGGACSAALVADGRLLARRFEERRRGQAERLLPLLQETLEEAGLGWSELVRLAVTRGPGSFTGVRIGLATARALALASGRPLLALDGFALLAATVRARLPAAERRGRGLAVLIDARRADLFLQCFDAAGAPLDPPLGPPASVLPEMLAEVLAERFPGGPLLLAGDAAAQALPFLAGREVEALAGIAHADAVELARLAAVLPLPAPGAPPPAPLYLRPPDVTLPGGLSLGSAPPGAVS